MKTEAEYVCVWRDEHGRIVIHENGETEHGKSPCLIFDASEATVFAWVRGLLSLSEEFGEEQIDLPGRFDRVNHEW